MKILLAAHLGMCFGVRDAIALALGAARTGPVTILGDLVHNEIVLQNLRQQGVAIAHQVADVTTPDLWITAHGTSERQRQQVRAAGLEIREATCPLVHHAHRSLQTLVAEGCYPVIIGRREHVEVRGLTEDLAQFSVVLNESDVAEVPPQPRYGVIAQTTQPIERVTRLVERLRQARPDSNVRFVDTVCQPTKSRQLAALELAKQCQVIVVIGGSTSNNTLELVATCRRHCARVHHVQQARELRAAWFKAEDVVGITAGTSTPDTVIAEVEQWLREFAEFQERLVEHVGTETGAASNS